MYRGALFGAIMLLQQSESVDGVGDTKLVDDRVALALRVHVENAGMPKTSGGPDVPRAAGNQEHAPLQFGSDNLHGRASWQSPSFP